MQEKKDIKSITFFRFSERKEFRVIPIDKLYKKSLQFDIVRHREIK